MYIKERFRNMLQGFHSTNNNCFFLFSNLHLRVVYRIEWPVNATNISKGFFDERISIGCFCGMERCRNMTITRARSELSDYTFCIFLLQITVLPLRHFLEVYF